MLPQLTCKLVVLGDSGVGKTALIHNLISQEFRADYKATIGADFSSKTCFIGNRQVELQIWDTAGDVRFHSVGAAFYRGTDACILVYDITQRGSFERLEMWREDLISKVEMERIDEFPFVIFANKSDLEEGRQVTVEEGLAFAESINCHHHFQASAKTGENVEDGFTKIAELFLAYVRNEVQTVAVRGVSLTENREEKGKCC